MVNPYGDHASAIAKPVRPELVTAQITKRAYITANVLEPIVRGPLANVPYATQTPIAKKIPKQNAAILVFANA